MPAAAADKSARSLSEPAMPQHPHENGDLQHASLAEPVSAAHQEKAGHEDIQPASPQPSSPSSGFRSLEDGSAGDDQPSPSPGRPAAAPELPAPSQPAPELQPAVGGTNSAPPASSDAEAEVSLPRPGSGPALEHGRPTGTGASQQEACSAEPKGPAPSGSDDGFGTFEDAPVAPEQPDASPVASQPHPAPQESQPDSSDDGFGTFEDVPSAAEPEQLAASPVASQPDPAPQASVSDDGFGTFEDAPAASAAAPPDAPEATQPPSTSAAPASAAADQQEPSGSAESDSDDGFGTFEDAPSGPEASPVPPDPAVAAASASQPTAAAPAAAPQRAQPVDGLSMLPEQFLLLAQQLAASLAPPVVPVDLADVVRLCDDMESAAKASLPEGSPLKQKWLQPLQVTWPMALCMRR